MKKIKQNALKKHLNTTTQPLNKALSATKNSITPFTKGKKDLKKPLSEYKPKILLVEDDPIAQFVQRRMLMKLNCHVSVASNARQALEMAENNYDVIFLDIGLPDIHGTEVAMAIKRLSKVRRHTRIIVITMHKEDELKRECLAVGVEKVVYKPVSVDILKELIFSH